MSQTTSTATFGNENSDAEKGGPITVYSTTWCPDCHRTKAFLKSNDIAFEEIDIEAKPEAAEIVAAHNNGKHVVPTLAIGDQHYGNPSIDRLQGLFGLA